MIDWTDAFDNSGYVPGSGAFAPRWAAEAAAFRDIRPPREIGYGPRTRQRLDLFEAEGARGLVVFVHGGYWKSLDRSLWSHLAAGPLARGWSVAIPSYTLAPEARIAAIGREIAQAVGVAAAEVAGPVRLIGHSAGGQLVARLAAGTDLIDAEMRARLAHVVPVSGVFDLRPVRLADLNDTLGIDAAEAEAESPVLLPPGAAPVSLWVGAAERPEFLRQTRALGEAWAARGAPVREVYEAGHHHFSVIEGLARPDSPLTTALMEEIA